MILRPLLLIGAIVCGIVAFAGEPVAAKPVTAPDGSFSAEFPCADVETRQKGNAQILICSHGGLIFSVARDLPSPIDERRAATYADLRASAQDDSQLKNISETSIGGHRAFRSVTFTPDVMVCVMVIDVAPASPLLVVAGEDHPSPIPATERADSLKLAEHFCDSVKVLTE